MDRMGIFVTIVLLAIMPFNGCVKSDCREKQKMRVGLHGNYTWPRRNVSVAIDGDIVLGALHGVHEKSDSNTCGPIKEQGGIQVLETMLYTLDFINDSPHILPGVKLGLLAKDDCDNDEYGLELARELFRDSIANISEPDSSCMSGSVPDRPIIHIPGVIGASSSGTSIRLASLLKSYKIPQVSFFSTSTVLSNKDRFPYFLRTIPSDASEAQVMVELVRTLNWTYVSVMYEDSRYGLQGHGAIGGLFKHYNICIARSEILREDAGNNYYDIIARRLLNTKARGVIILASGREVSNLMNAFHRNGITETFSWIWGDSTDGSRHDFHGNEAAFEGALTVRRQVRDVRGFKDHFLSLNPFHNKRNPWFVEFWEQQFKCKFPGSSWTPYNEDYNRACTGSETIDPHGYPMEERLQFVSESVLAFAYALDNIHQDVCGAGSDLCDDMNPVDGELLMGYLLNVSFHGLSRQTFRFLPNGDSSARYVISTLTQEQSGQYSWHEVGHFESGIPLSLRLDEKKYRKSVCSEPCGPGQTQVSSHDQCCWVCLGATNGGRIQTNLAFLSFLGVFWSLWPN